MEIKVKCRFIHFLTSRPIDKTAPLKKERDVKVKTVLIASTLLFVLLAISDTPLVTLALAETTPMKPEPFLFDPSKYYTIQEAEGEGPEYWVGAPGIFYDHEIETFWLVYRYRKPHPERGHKLVIAKSTDGVHFTDVWSASKSEFRFLNEAGKWVLGAWTISRSAILKDPHTNKFKLYVSLGDPAGVYKLDDVDDPAYFNPATSRLVLSRNVDATEWDSYAITYPWVAWVGDRYVMLYNGVPSSIAVYTFRNRIGLATSIDGESWTRHPDNPILEPGPNWLVHWDWLGVFQGSIMFLPEYWGVYYMSDAKTGLALWQPPPPPYRKLEKITVNAPLSIKEPISFLTSITAQGKTFFYYQAATSDGSIDLRVSVVERARIEKSFSPASARLGDIVGVQMKFYMELPYTSVTIVDKLPSELTYWGGFSDSLVPGAVPTVDGNTLTYTANTAGEHILNFNVKVTRAYDFDQTITNPVNATYQAPYYPYAYPDALLTSSADLSVKSFVPPSPSKSFSSISANLGDIVGVTAKFYVTSPYTTATIVDKLPSELLYWGGFSDNLVPSATPSVSGNTITYAANRAGEHILNFNVKVTTAYDFDKTITNKLDATYLAAYYPDYQYYYPDVLLTTLADLTIKSFMPSFSKSKTAGPDSITVSTSATWENTITINNPYTYIMNAKVTDNLGANLAVSIVSYSGGTPSLYLNKAGNQYRLSWGVSVAQGATATLVLQISTTGIKTLGDKVINSGATIKFLDPDGTQLSAKTSPIVVTVVP